MSTLGSLVPGTASGPASARPGPASRGRRWTGTGRMARLELRTGWIGLTVWPLAMAGLVWATAAGARGLYLQPAARAVYGATVGVDPASIAFNGRGYDLGTLGGITVNEVGFFGLLFLPVVAAHLAIRHTRAQEDSGRTELVTAARVGRSAPLAGAALVVALALVLTGLLSALALMANRLPLAGSVYYAAALVLHMIVYLGVGLLAGQVSQTARSAHGLALGAIGAVYLVRALIDGRSWDATWATPMGWLAQVRPYGDLRIWPYVALAALACLLCLAAVVVCGRRDLGAGLVTPRPGPAVGTRRLTGPVGLLWRITRGTAYVWGAGTVTWGFALGLLSQETSRMFDTNPGLAKAFGGDASQPEQLMTSVAAVLVALLSSAVAVQGMARLGGEEASGRLGLAIAGRFGRTRWWLSAVGLLAGQAGCVLGLGGLGYDLGAALASGRVGTIGRGLTACMEYAPAVVLTAAISALLLSASLRIVAGAWAVFLWSAVVAMLADTLRLPAWSRDLSPLHHIGRVPFQAFDGRGAAVMAGLALVGIAGSVLLLRRRDLAAG